MNNEQRDKLLYRIKQTQDGLDFIEYLKQLSHENYNEWKCCNNNYQDGIVKGVAIAYDNLIKVFENCVDKEVKKDQTEINAFI